VTINQSDLIQGKPEMPVEFCQYADLPTTSHGGTIGFLSFPNCNLHHVRRLSLNNLHRLFSLQCDEGSESHYGTLSR